MKRFLERILRIAYTDKFVFGGFEKDGNRMFFVIPCIRICFCNYPGSYGFTFGFGILFWEFVFTVEIWKKL